MKFDDSIRSTMKKFTQKKSLIDSKNLTKSKPAIGAEGERASRVGVAMKK